MAQGLPLSHDVYLPPDPVKVADVWDYSSPAAACERWHWVSSATLSKLAVAGRKLRSARAGVVHRTSRARSTTAEQDRAAVAAVRRTGSVPAAAAELGMTRAVLSRILREAGETAPRMDRREVGRRGAETRRARAAA